MLKALLVFRPLNLCIMALTQWLVYYFLGKSGQSVWLILLLSGSTILIAAAGNMLNDYYDRKRDEINKPGRNYSDFWVQNNLLWPIYTFLNLAALYLGYLLNSWLAVIILFCAILMFLYNYSWKDLPLIGNLTISFLIALSILLVRILNKDIDASLILYYAMFAMFLTWARELVKDLEDREGDATVGARNLTLSVGEKNSLMFVRLLLIFVLALFVTAWPVFKSFLHLNVQTTAMTYGILCICVPIIALIVMSYLPQKNFTQMSHMSKYIMVTGVLSMLFF